MRITKLISLITIAGGCAVDSTSTTIAVEQDNDLGVTTLEMQRTRDGANTVFELRGYSDAHEQLASVQLTTGVIQDLSRWAPGEGDTGADIVVTVAGAADHRVTREIEYIVLSATADTSPFLSIATVAATLEANTHLIVQTSDEVSYATRSGTTDIQYHEGSVPSTDEAADKPPAGQACLSVTQMIAPQVYSSSEIIQVVLSNNSIGHRYKYRGSAPCTASDGTTMCNNGSIACYYGPLGFSRPTVSVPPVGYPYPYVYTVTHNINTGTEIETGTSCSSRFSATPVTPIFPTVVGTGGSCGCCTNGTGACCGTACASCSGGVVAHALVGQWDM